MSRAQILNLLLPSVSQIEKRSPRGGVGRNGEGEGTTGCGRRRRGWEGEEEMDICSGRRMKERRGKGSGKERRDWFMVGLRQGPRLTTEGRSAEHQAACSTDRVLAGSWEVPALAWCRKDHGLAGGKPGHPGSSVVRQRQESTFTQGPGSVILSCSPTSVAQPAGTTRPKVRTSDAQSWRSISHQGFVRCEDNMG